MGNPGGLRHHWRQPQHHGSHGPGHAGHRDGGGAAVLAAGRQGGAAAHPARGGAVAGRGRRAARLLLVDGQGGPVVGAGGQRQPQPRGQLAVVRVGNRRAAHRPAGGAGVPAAGARLAVAGAARAAAGDGRRVPADRGHGRGHVPVPQRAGHDAAAGGARRDGRRLAAPARAGGVARRGLGSGAAVHAARRGVQARPDPDRGAQGRAALLPPAR